MRYLFSISLVLMVLMALACTVTPTVVLPTSVPTATPTICESLSTDLAAARTETAASVLTNAWIENGCQDGLGRGNKGRPEDKSEGKTDEKSESKPEGKSEPESSCLTAGEIFQMNDAGELSDERAVAMLGELKQGENCIGSGLKKKQPSVLERPAEKDNPDKSEGKAEEKSESKSEPDARRGTLEWVNQLEDSIHMLVNEERILESLSVLRSDDKLSDIARRHSEDMARNNYFAHVSPQNQDPTDRANSSGYRCNKTVGRFIYSGIAENIFSGWLYSSITYVGPIKIKDYMSLNEIAAEVVDGWMDSPGHRQNILTKMYDREGIGVAVNPGNDELLVTQNFC